jgi:hypothetical protein
MFHVGGRGGTVIHGVYGHPRPFWEQGLRLDEIGVNAIFVHSGALDSATIERRGQRGARCSPNSPR